MADEGGPVFVLMNPDFAVAGKSENFFWGVGGFWTRFLGGQGAFPERQGGFWAWNTPLGAQNAPFLRDSGATSGWKEATIASFLPRRTLVLATMLWSEPDGMAVFPRSLARDLRAGEGECPLFPCKQSEEQA